VIATVVLGATNLYLLSRHYGHRLLEGRLGRLIHVTPERLDKAEAWFGRYGALTIIFGRHVPGLRIPITVAAGLLRVPYRVFAPSVVVSTAIWAGIGLWLGATVGAAIGNVLFDRGWIYIVGLGLVIVVLAIALVRAWRSWGPRRAVTA